MRLVNLLLAAMLVGIQPAAAAVSGGTVHIAVLTGLHGIYAALGGQAMVSAVEMAVEDAGGSVAGAPVEIHVLDTEWDAEHAVELARQLDEKYGLDLITGQIASNVGLALQAYAEQNDIAIIHSGPSSTTFVGKACSPVGVQWNFNTYALSKASVGATVREGGEEWFFLTADYEFGHNLKQNAASFVERYGGEVLGEAVTPYGGTSFAPQIIQAINSGADVIGLASAGSETQQAIRQGYELGVQVGGQSMVAIEFYITDIRHLGLYVTQGLTFATSFYWNFDDRTRAFSERFYKRVGSMPTTPQAGVYSGVAHYLAAVDALGADGGRAVVEQMKDMPVDDFFARNGHVRADGRVIYDMYLVKVKKPIESRRAWDYLNVLSVIPGEDAFRPLAESECPMVVAGG